MAITFVTLQDVTMSMQKRKIEVQFAANRFVFNEATAKTMSISKGDYVIFGKEGNSLFVVKVDDPSDAFQVKALSSKSKSLVVQTKNLLKKLGFTANTELFYNKEKNAEYEGKPVFGFSPDMANMPSQAVVVATRRDKILEMFDSKKYTKVEIRNKLYGKNPAFYADWNFLVNANKITDPRAKRNTKIVTKR